MEMHINPMKNSENLILNGDAGRTKLYVSNQTN